MSHPYQQLVEAAALLGLRPVAWRRHTAQEGAPRLVGSTHFAWRLADGQPDATRPLLCGRALPDAWDVGEMRYEHIGWGDCRRCWDAYARRTAQGV